MSANWRGGSWTASNWDDNNWLGPNEVSGDGVGYPPGLRATALQGSLGVVVDATQQLEGLRATSAFGVLYPSVATEEVTQPLDGLRATTASGVLSFSADAIVALTGLRLFALASLLINPEEYGQQVYVRTELEPLFTRRRDVELYCLFDVPASAEQLEIERLEASAKREDLWAKFEVTEICVVQVETPESVEVEPVDVFVTTEPAVLYVVQKVEQAFLFSAPLELIAA